MGLGSCFPYTMPSPSGPGPGSHFEQFKQRQETANLGTRADLPELFLQYTMLLPRHLAYFMNFAGLQRRPGGSGEARTALAVAA